MKWETVNLGDVLHLIIGGGTPSKSKSEYWNGDIFWCSVKDMEDDKHYLSYTKDTITKKGLENSSANLIKAGTVITSTRMGLGRAFINKVDMAINQDLKALIPNERIDNRFLLWTIVSKRNELNMLGRGSTVKGITLDILKSIEIALPPLIVQRRIADILSAYDDLIENNQKQIKLLEEAAMRLYKEWFVNLRFPGYENTKIVDGVPEGWELTTVKEMGQVITGKTPSTVIAENYGKDIPFVKIPDMHGVIYPLKTEVKLSERGANTQKNKLLPPKSIMVSCIATVGLVCIAHEACQTNQQINSIILNDEDHLYYMFFKMKGIKSLLEGVGSNGATMTNVNKTKFENIELLKPENEILKKFNNLVEPFFSNILALSKQNEKLKEARDKLLSKLMSGEIEV
jgi:type I restriction enzyme S subunit